MQRILGIDFGSKRIGLALSDETGKFAIPFIVIQNKKGFLDEIIKTAEQNDVKVIVIGESRDYKGQPNAIHDSILELKRQLYDAKYEVNLEPEFMTSIQAERFQGKNDMTDASAAALILQSYLDRSKTK